MSVSAVDGWSNRRWQYSRAASGLLTAQGSITFCVELEKLGLGLQLCLEMAWLRLADD